jgi:hypothetical protein
LEARRAEDALRREHEKAVENQIKHPQPKEGISTEQALKNAAELEAKLIPGAPTRTPRAKMLEAPEAVALNPDKGLRWGNIRDPQKMETHQMDGYKRLTSEEGGKQLGNELVLIGIPKQLAEARIAEQKAINAERLTAHVRTMESAAEGIARELRDKHGLNIDPKRLFVNEG